MAITVMEQRAPELRADADERRSLGQRLRRARKAAGLTLEATAEVVGVVRQAISKWEIGENYPTGDRLRKVAELYGVSLDWLMGKEKRIGETPELYYPGETPPTEEEMRLAMEFIRAMRLHRFKHLGQADGPSPPGGDD